MPDLERYKKEDNDIYTQVGGSRTATEDSVITVPRKSASFESKELIGLGFIEVDFSFNQTSEELKSRTAEVEVEKTVADVSLQIEDLNVSSGDKFNSASVDEMVVFAKAITLTGSKNTISERLRNACKTIRLLEEGIEVDEVQYNVDIKNIRFDLYTEKAHPTCEVRGKFIKLENKMLIASNPWPSLTDRLYRYMHNLSHRQNVIRLILRNLVFSPLHGAFFRYIIF
ncbi:unnamed protein product [Brugia timori]|uniref:DBD_Tnp_Mut domain-containing protein n=1 Tax=Brugia timori TaxID=42155 RepID=A0A0R3QM04_9BILA|nr:unnamed protein product [Brugia timori]